ncbi:hypothetical protein PGT21_024045 [Puccinia graminis f. sp. tritici]|uniref:Uncharacterized protein n=1 Tax=Puccinia graminis f. sp. tritici TaxID=56615 RepID=A0A5B0MWV9_PUCGR|nr:hypothetical protein PGT21_024045 [Puccinia graminis f. sp. tritici]
MINVGTQLKDFNFLNHPFGSHVRRSVPRGGRIALRCAQLGASRISILHAHLSPILTFVLFPSFLLRTIKTIRET